MTPALLRLLARQVLPWLSEDDRVETGRILIDGRPLPTVRVHATLDKWGDWSHPPTRTLDAPAERIAIWWGGALVVALHVRRAVEVDA